MVKKQQMNETDANAIEAGMVVEATKGDLGEEDVSKPKVTDVVQDQQGNAEKIVVEKGVIFKKEIEIPVDRIQNVEHASGADGKVAIDARENEIEALTSVGHERLNNKAESLQQDEDDLLSEVEGAIPTAEGLREMESDSAILRAEGGTPTVVETTTAQWLRMLGPGFLGGMAGNDSSAVASYSIDGASNGFGHLWLMFLSTPLYLATQFACAQLGRVTQKGLAEVAQEHYGRWVAVSASLILIVANVALIAADLVAIGSGFELITGLSWIWYVVPVGALIWYLTVYRSFESIKKIFIVMSLAFVAYIVTAIIARPNWGAILFNTFVPHIDYGFASISSAVALLGATISPYTIFWQVQGEKEEKRPGTMRQKLRFAAFDIGVGVVSGNLVAYFIIVCTAATLFVHHKNIATAADAAQALVPVLGPFARYLFAIGLIGAGLVAIPVLLASTSYAVAGSFGWPAGLSKKPWQSEGFYLFLTFALLTSVVMALLRLDPIRLLFWANVLSGVLSPFLVVYLIIVGNNRKIMRDQRLGVLTNIGLVLTAVVMFTASALLFYGLATGQGR